jgi:hypothetical protein
MKSVIKKVKYEVSCQVCDQVYNQVREQVWNQVRISTRNLVWNQVGRNVVIKASAEP